MKKVKQLCRLLVILPLSLLTIPAWSSTDESVAQLRLDYAAFRAAEDDYRAQREFSGLGGAEAADYASYVARLQRRVFEDCQAVIRSGSSFPEDLPCPVLIPQATQSADIATQTEQTPGEQIAALDSILNEGLGEYDEKLLREQERIKSATPNDNSSGNGEGQGGSGDAGDGEGDADGDEGGEEGDGQNTGSEAGDNREGQQGGSPPRSGPQDSSTGSRTDGNDRDQPADIPDGSDDDVVARQLREAAEKETDPELKAKLWEEYRRYKRGTS